MSFPKSYNIAKGIEAKILTGSANWNNFRVLAGERREGNLGYWKSQAEQGYRPQEYEGGGAFDLEAQTDLARIWDGWGTALKPAWEPIILARKPRRGTYAECAVEHGAGALWIDGTRIYHSELEKHTKRVAQREGNALQFNTGKSKGWVEGTMASAHPTGRWPANVILSHHPDCVRVGTKKVKGSYLNHDIKGDHTQFSFRGKARTHNTGYTDLDGLETVEAWECVEGCPVKMLDEMSGERPVSGSARSGKPATRGNYDKPWHIFHMPHQGTLHNDSGGASRFFYTAKSSRRERNAGLPEGMQNNHCTVKSLSICEYLAKLIRPPEEYLDEAVILVPFCGTGSEIIGAIRAGWRNWLGIEISEEYAEIARARIAYWQGRVEDERAQLAMELG